MRLRAGFVYRPHHRSPEFHRRVQLWPVDDDRLPAGVARVARTGSGSTSGRAEGRVVRRRPRERTRGGRRRFWGGGRPSGSTDRLGGPQNGVSGFHGALVLPDRSRLTGSRTPEPRRPSLLILLDHPETRRVRGCEQPDDLAHIREGGWVAFRCQVGDRVDQHHPPTSDAGLQLHDRSLLHFRSEPYWWPFLSHGPHQGSGFGGQGSLRVRLGFALVRAGFA